MDQLVPAAPARRSGKSRRLALRSPSRCGPFAGAARAVDLRARPTGLSQLLAAYDLGTAARGIATFDAAPTAMQRERPRRSG